jgi:hypothetical protein
MKYGVQSTPFGHCTPNSVLRTEMISLRVLPHLTTPIYYMSLRIIFTTRLVIDSDQVDLEQKMWICHPALADYLPAGLDLKGG